MQPTTAQRPRFTIVSAVYNVSRYLEDFIASIERQTFDLGRLEVIMVDDGSTDDSAAVLGRWQERRPGMVQVVTKPNGGQGSARNLGMTMATGEWITFLDPDDMIGEPYLANVDQFLTENPTTAMVATHRLFYRDPSGAIDNTHPLRSFFSGQDRLVDLDGFPDRFHGSAPSAFLRLDHLRATGLEFDERIQPNFEDGAFCMSYLLAVESPQVGFLPSAEYLYRKRADMSSTLQNSLTHPGRYTNVLEFGYLAVLRRAQELKGRPPEWLQNIIIYELSYYLSAEAAPSGSSTACTGAVADRFHELMREIVALLDPTVVAGFRIRNLRPVWRDILLHTWSGADWHTPYAVLDEVDPGQGLVRVVYRYVGEPPSEEFRSRGSVVAPHHAKVRDVVMFDRVVMHERIAWVTNRGSFSARLDDDLVPLRYDWPQATLLAVRPKDLSGNPNPPRKALGGPRSVTRPLAVGPNPERLTQLGPRLLRRLARSRPVRRMFGGAWVFIDRVHDADDSAEHLFRYVREHRPDVKAYFVVERDTADWKRLQADGYGSHVVAHGSQRWKLLMANAKYLISSHIDVPIQRPPEILAFIRPRWRFVFLQHGVIKDNLSNWLNNKRIDLFVTSTPNEYASIAGEGTPYTLTTKEVKLTGLPRFDEVLRTGERFPPQARDLVLVAPTWRHWLTPPLAPGSQRRTVYEDFLDTAYARNWLGLLASDRVREAALAQGLRIGFLPHPNLQSVLDDVELPDHVVPLRFEGEDVRSYFARAAVLITDYSSMAFNAAYIDRPVVYFQFDADRMFGGDHVGRGGYFDYATQGFGPVTTDLAGAETALIEALEHGREPMSPYLERIAATFPWRDGRNSERVVAAIDDLERRLSWDEAVTPLPAPVPVTLS